MKHILLLLSLFLLITCSTTNNYIASEGGSAGGVAGDRSTKHLPRASFVFVSVKEMYKFCFKGIKSLPICIHVGSPRHSSGSGFVVANNSAGSLAITAEHVCSASSPGMDIKIVLTDLDGNEYPAKVVAEDAKNDICMLKAKGLHRKAVQMSMVPPYPGDRLYNISAPLGIFDKQMVPILEGRYDGESNGSAIYSLPAAPGSSGSMVLNSRFEIVGLVHSLHIRFPTISLGPTYKSIKEFIEKNIAKYN